MNMLKSILIGCVVLLVSFHSYSEEIEYPAYYKLASIQTSIDQAIKDVTATLESNGFEIIGQYHPGSNPDLAVLCYTRQDLEDITLKFKDRGALANAMKIGFVNNNGTIDISMLNPEYIFYAYLLEDINPYTKQLEGISQDAKNSLSVIGSGDLQAFGGFQTREDLEDYHYKIMMPYFTDPEDLADYNSFEEGLNIIRKNLEAKKGNTVKVYELVYPEEKIAVFGIGLLDKEEGESYFLPIIGEDHIAAMPYEIILQNNEVTMLRGKYRIALHWPELTMGTFMKIMSTPGDIEDFMEQITEK